ncbi:alpha-2,3-sialyltransferase [Campylobacter sp. MIT 99-7217]|uniref:alpha-2,3-sialyltransferase n=1 Tax=Campylobacter sp. MIT 99-7217 TaxID=535091 RepID=UPI001156F42A|nr:alpha-2,3-sialyltransferase [Campylobacter sp. MIT 99-7217]TQR29372.1 alpha-2,3-sialyltransferase [Campylobacter sp. MIT 99-7217]
MDSRIKKLIHKIHAKLSLEFGLNFIDMQEYYEKYELFEFGSRIDGGHQQARIICEFGKNIINSLPYYQKPRTNLKNDLPKFKIINPSQMKLLNGNLKEIIIKNSAFNERIYRLNEDTKLAFAKELNGFYLLGIHSWNNMENREKALQIPPGWFGMVRNFSSVAFENENEIFTKEMGFINQFISVHKNFKLENTKLFINKDKKFSEFHVNVETWAEDARQFYTSDIINFFLANACKLDFEVDFKDIQNTHFQIPKEYNFNHLIPPVEVYKEIIDEYCAVMDTRKLGTLQNENTNLKIQISTLQNELTSLPILKQKQELKNLSLDESIKKLELKKLEKSLGLKLSKLEPKISLNLEESIKTSALTRVRNHLAYKLGQAIIICNKSLFGILSLPFVLSYIRAKHKKEQNALEALIKQNPNLALPKLETYADYEKALKEKECFTYKLGEAIMKADKTWYKGGYIKFYFEAKKLEREFRGKL